MKFLILGANGMAGHQIGLYLQEQGHDVIGFTRNKSLVLKNYIIGDATDFVNLNDVIKNGKFDVIINCIGILNQFAENDHPNAVLINSFLPHFLAENARQAGSYLIHMSTDCVFSGNDGKYTELDIPDGATFYDRTKALGELNDNYCVTFRNSIVGPDINENGIGLLNWFMKQNGEVNGFTGAIWTGQTTLQLAKTMEQAAKERPTGLFNMVPSSSINKYDLLGLFNKYLRNGEVKINPVNGISADKSLLRTNFSFNYQIPDYDQMISEAAQWIFNHKSLYPHYNLK